MVTRLRHLLLALSLSAGFAGCGGSSSGPGLSPFALPPDSGTPTSTGPVGGTVVPFVPETPSTVPPADAPPVPETPSTAPPADTPPATTPTAPAIDTQPETPSTTPPVHTQPAAPSNAPPPKFSPVTRFDKQVPAVQDGAIYATEAGDYDLGSVIVSSASTPPLVFLARIHGGIWYPGKPTLASSTPQTKFPVVLLLHGQHSPGVPNYQGYEYLAVDLAAQGYVVLSIDANDINANGESTSQSRGQLVLATLDKLKKINDGTQTTNGIALQSLVGKIDLDRVGIMGHSRGGQGINDAIQLNDQRIGVTLAQLRSAVPTLRDERLSWVSKVWFSAAGAARTTGTRQAFLKTLDDLIAALNQTPSMPNAELSTFLDQNNITLAASAATGPEAPPKYVFKAALSLAPTDFRLFQKIANVPFAAMVPSCDGDVAKLNGAHVFDRNRFGRDAADTAPRFQVVVRGANHNYFNSVWTGDDYPERAADYCYLNSMVDSGIRLAPAHQVAVGLFVINSFMRHFVGGEAAFAPYWNGSAPLPAKACPGGRWPCDSRVALTLQTNGQTNGLNNHKVIAPFDDAYGFNQPYDGATSMLRVGHPLDLIDSTAFAGNLHTCAADLTRPDTAIPTKCTPLMQPDAFFRVLTIEKRNFNMSSYSGGFVSAPNQLLLGLTRPDMPLTITLREPVVGTGAPDVTADPLSSTGYDTLSFRIAMVRPAPATEGPLPRQEVSVMLTDGNGVDSPAIKVSDFSDALDSSMGLTVPAGSRAAELLNMVAIPLAAFKPDPASGSAFDPARLKTLTLKFVNAPNDGTKVALTDLQLQIFGRALR